MSQQVRNVNSHGKQGRDNIAPSCQENITEVVQCRLKFQCYTQSEERPRSDCNAPLFPGRICCCWTFELESSQNEEDVGFAGDAT